MLGCWPEAGTARTGFAAAGYLGFVGLNAVPPKSRHEASARTRRRERSERGRCVQRPPEASNALQLEGGKSRRSRSAVETSASPRWLSRMGLGLPRSGLGRGSLRCRCHR